MKSSSKGRTRRQWLLWICITLTVSLQLSGLVSEQQQLKPTEESFATVIASPANATGACSGYDGILHISSGDEEGAAGTIFFLFVLNQLAYADKYNLLPFVHLSSVSRHVYDPVVHESTKTYAFETMCGKQVSWESYTDPKSLREVIQYPGKPIMSTPHISKCNITLQGNGVWNSYFAPVFKFSPDDPSCKSLPLIRLSYAQLIPGLHNFAPSALRAWRYRGLPPSRRQMDKTYNEWFAPMRKLGNSLVQKYVHFLPYLQELAAQQMPSNTRHCMAIHIRHSDKANRRRKIPVANFLPYVQAYFSHQKEQQQHQNFAIFLATDSSNVIEMIKSTWPSEILDVLHWQKGNVVRSNDTTAVFQMVTEDSKANKNNKTGHHQTNVEVLTDILAMSKCQYMVHGLSAVTEAVHYLNPTLHNRSVNLDYQKKELTTVDQFRDMLENEDGY